MSERYTDGFEDVGTNVKRPRRILIDDELDAIDVVDALKAPLASPTFTGTVVLPSTTSIGTVSATEIAYLDNVTSAIQTQLNAKAATGATVIAPIAVDANGTAIAAAVNGIITALIAAGVLAIA